MRSAFLALVLLVFAHTFEPTRAAAATISMGKEGMKMSSTGPDSTLPSFFFMAGAEEGGSLFSGYGFKGGRGEPNPFEVPVQNCPDDIYEDTSEDLRVPQLPWALQDDWGCERVPGEADVIVMENEIFRAAITPQWGGKVWSLEHKKMKRQMFYNNPAHQPENIGYRKAWTSGGAEWNWAPGHIGHSVFSESPVFAGTIQTERGPLLRVYEFDRQNFTTWQVDMLLDNETDIFWVHPRITNSNPADLKGYWWTCVAMRINETSRIVVPAEQSVTPCVSWPRGAWTLTNTTFAGPDLQGCASTGTCAWEQDMSFLGNIPTNHDFFFRIYQPQTPYIALAETDGFTVLHSHPLNGTKFFTWGMKEQGTWSEDFMSASDYTNANCTKPYYDPTCPAYEHEGAYTELQIGPAPTQMHTFPLPAESVYEWTEWFKAWRADPSKMQDPDYSVPLREVDAFMSSKQGVSAGKTRSMDDFFKKYADIPPEKMLWQGMPYAGLYEEASGRKLAPGCPFPKSPANISEAPLGIRPWLELLRNGEFSPETLSATPINFEVDALWMQLLRSSMAKNGETWLHRLYLGTEALEVGNVDAARTHFEASFKLKANVHSARNLATFAPTMEEAVKGYEQAWSLWKQLDASADPAATNLGKDLASEMSAWLMQNEQWDALSSILDDVATMPEAATFRSKDKILHAKAALAMSSHGGAADFATAIDILTSHCFPTYGSDRKMLIDLWWNARVAKAVDENGGRSLTKMQMIKLRRQLGCDGDSTTSTLADKCMRGPPNLGYPYG